MSKRPTAEQRGDPAVERVVLLIDANRPQDAIHAAHEGLQADPTNADLMGLIGRALLTQGDAMGARAWAEWSLSIEPATGWVHDLRARALLDGAGPRAEALAAAKTAVQSDPLHEDFLFTFVQACLENRDRRGAEQAVRTLRHTAPASTLGPLAEALVELDRGHVYFQRRYSLGPLVVVAVVTQGTSLVLMGIWWVIRAVWRVPYLRRADAFLHEALAMDPGSAAVRAVAADVLRLRFRLAQSVDYEVAAAAIETGLVDANALATTISRRTTALTVVCSIVWLMTMAAIYEPIGADTTVAAIGAALAGLLVGLVAGFDRWQTRSLPRLLLRNVRGRWPLAVAVSVPTLWVIPNGASYLFDPEHPASGYHLASLVVAPLAAICTGIVLTRLAAARRAH